MARVGEKKDFLFVRMGVVEVSKAIKDLLKPFIIGFVVYLDILATETTKGLHKVVFGLLVTSSKLISTFFAHWISVIDFVVININYDSFAYYLLM